MTDLFSNARPNIEEIYPDVFVLANFVKTSTLLIALEKIVQQTPFQKMMTPMGHLTRVALTNCGEYGWTSDAKGYRYSKQNPRTRHSWPPLPESYSRLAKKAASAAGHQDFVPDACLINQYLIGDKLGSHQDKNEKDFSQPIVSVSIGLPAVFQIFGDSRSGIEVEYLLYNGDVMVWGNRARLIYHGVRAIKPNRNDPSQSRRINITFRKSH